MAKIIALRKNYQDRKLDIRKALRQSYYDQCRNYAPIPQPYRTLMK
jgi:hypothetical protein